MAPAAVKDNQVNAVGIEKALADRCAAHYRWQVASCVESRGEIEDMTANLDVFVVPASVLAPKEKP